MDCCLNCSDGAYQSVVLPDVECLCDGHKVVITVDLPLAIEHLMKNCPKEYPVEPFKEWVKEMKEREDEMS